MCGRPSTDVDHIIPIEGQKDPLFFDVENVQALCHSCHSKKTASIDGGYGRKKKDTSNNDAIGDPEGGKGSNSGLSAR